MPWPKTPKANWAPKGCSSVQDEKTPKLNYSIIEGSLIWEDRYREFCKRAYQATYPRPELGLPADLFSDEFFNSPSVKQHFKELCTITDSHKMWLALDSDQSIIGTVAARNYPEYCDMKAFYVTPELKGHGIGHALYQRVLSFAGNRAIQVDVVTYLQEAIDMYKHWGFHIDESKGMLQYPIVEWPEAAVNKYQAIYMVKPASKK
jgi:GNAT superfamily N-acetyltransferase